MQNSIVEFNEFEAQLTEFKSIYDGIVYDLTDKDQEKSARSDRLSIGKVISSLDSAHKALKAPLKAKTDLIDAERKRIKDDLLGVQGKIKAQIAEHEAQIAEHAEMLQVMVENIEDLARFDVTGVGSNDINERLELARSVDVGDEFEHRKADAALAQIDSIKTLESMLESTKKQEAEQAELERLREDRRKREQAEREEKIRADAEAKAKREAEESIQREKDAKERAELDAEQARLKAAEDKKQAIIDAEFAANKAAEAAAAKERARLEAEAKAKIEKEVDEKAKEDAKKSKQDYRAKIHKQAKESMCAVGIDDTVATAIVSAIKDGLIANVAIIY